jgi:hypothetical protein
VGREKFQALGKHFELQSWLWEIAALIGRNERARFHKKTHQIDA